MIERGIMTHHSHHAAHRWRALGVFDVEFHIGGEMTIMAVLDRNSR
jgi:hypothetical protein